MAMTMAQRRALGMTLKNMSEELDVTHVVRYLRRREILTEPDEKTINAKSTNEKRVIEFVKIIQKRGEWAYSAFKEYLEEYRGPGNPASKLKEKLNTAEIKSEKREQIERWKTLEEKFIFFRCQHRRLCLYKNIPGEINIVLIGKTGSGKSATGNTIIGNSYFEASGASCSVTRKIDVKNTKEDRFNITVIDTPGLFNTDESSKNKDLMANIMEETSRSKIHLFLLLINPGRITNEDEKIIDMLEKVLSEDLSSKCVMVIPNARATFGGKAMRSLRDDIENVKEHGGKFATFLERVQDRIIAVENCFDDNSTKEFQRQRLLCYLAQVIYDELKYRSSGSSLIKGLPKMRDLLTHYLEVDFLPSLSLDEMDDPIQLSRKHVKLIMDNSGVTNIPDITEEAVLEYTDSFIQDKLIVETKGLKVEELEQPRKESDLVKGLMNTDTKSEPLQSNAVVTAVPIREKENKQELEIKKSPGSEKSKDFEPNTVDKEYCFLRGCCTH